MADGKNDIHTAGPECLNWDPADPVKSLQELRTFVEEESQKAISWYWREKNGKKTPSRAIQFLALALTAAAGLIPVVVQIVKNWDGQKLQGFDSGPVASLLVGSAAALLGLDKAFGYSSGWTRYVLTATSMTKLLNEFRMDWVLLYASCTLPPTPEKAASLIQRAKDFVSAIQGALQQETKEWATEFQSNTAQLEKDVRAQLDTLSAQVDKVAKEREDAARAGGIELTITNADKTDGFHVAIVLEGKDTKQSEAVTNSKVWTRIGTAPGQYKVALEAKVHGAPIATSMIVEVKPGEIARPSITFPV